jgi:DNA repair exonuclease SbcCD ATPase subunit
VPEPDANATKQEQKVPVGEELWQDKVLVDAIGYTKGLVAILDSLTDGFQRRGRELEDLRHRLTILQSERRSILDGQSGVDAQASVLSAERDALRATLDEREREVGKLCQELEQSQSALEESRRQLEELRRGAPDSARQVEELREVVRSLERQLQRTGQVPGRAPVAHGGQVSPTPSSAQASQADLAGLEELVSDQRPTPARDVSALTAERDELQTTLAEREREMEALRQEVVQGQAALDAHTREIQALRIGMAETVRQAEEIRKVLEGLERERESTAHHRAILEAELEAERRRVRETTARASQEQIALREDLADAENLLAEARKDIAASHGVIASLRRTADEERSRSAALQEQFKSQPTETRQHDASITAVQTLFGEIARALGAGADASSAEGREWAELEALAQDAAASTSPDEGALTLLHPITEALRDLWPPAERTGGEPSKAAVDAAVIRRHAEQIAERWRRILRERTGSGASAPTPDEDRRLAAESGTQKAEKEVHRDAPRSASARDRRSGASDGGRSAKSEPAPEPVGPAAARSKTTKRRGAPAGMTVECMLVATGKEEARILRGEISRSNNMGLLGTFDERFPEGRQVVVRFIRDGEVVSCLGRVVRVLESKATGDAAGACNHLIRFESTPAASGEELQTFAN